LIIVKNILRSPANIIKFTLDFLKQYIFANLRTGEFAKIINNVFRLIKVKFLAYPEMIYIEPCNTCNIRCPLCTQPFWKSGRSAKKLTYEEGVKIIDNLKGIGWRIFFGLGGEPLLNNDIFKLIKYANDKNFFTILSTNATLLDKKRQEELFDSGLDRILLSFDGINSHSYGQMRKGADFEQVIENIRSLCELKKKLGNIKPFIEINFIVTKFSESESEEAQSLVRGWGVEKFVFRKLTIPETVFSEEEHKAICKKYLPENTKYRKKRYSGEYENREQLCNYHTKCSAILADGRVVLCCTDFKAEYVLGNAIDQNFDEIWFSRKAKDIRNKGKHKSLPICSNCFPDD